MARGKVVDKEMVDLVLQMKARNEKLTTEQIGAVVECDATTAGRIIRCGSWEAFCEWKAEKARKEREKNAATATKTVELFSAGEKIAEIEGQIEMDLKEAEDRKTEKETAGYSDQTKLMRFQAGQVDKLIVQYGQWMDVINMRLEKLNDTMSMILRAVRKE